MPNAEPAGGYSASDQDLMAAAFRLARRSLGRVWPNPAVGCIIAKEGVIIARGFTQTGGRPHAEAEALRHAGSAAHGATVYVSLEPCAHHGQTPPCADALVAARIARAVIAVEDPDPRVSGGGIARLRSAGIAVETPLLATEAAALNAGFFLRVREGRPLFALKLATSLDGAIVSAGGDARWITGPAARAVSHRLRADYDAVLIGAGTALADDPDLTCRLPGLAKASPVRIVIDRRLRMKPDARLAATAKTQPVWVLTAVTADAARVAALRDAGVEVLPLPLPDDPIAAARLVAFSLGERGLTRVLIEGGASIAAAFIAADLIDALYWMTAPLLLGDDAKGALASLGVKALAAAPRFHLIGLKTAGDDIVAEFGRRV